MGKTGTVKHTHQYYKRIDGMWACSGYEGCTHYMPKNMWPAPTGHKSLCWSCEQPFQLTPVNMERGKPMCDACSDRIDSLDEFIEKKLAEANRAKRSVPKVIPDEVENYNPEE